MLLIELLERMSNYQKVFIVDSHWERQIYAGSVMEFDAEENTETILNSNVAKLGSLDGMTVYIKVDIPKSIAKMY